MTVDSVTSRATFVRFFEALRADLLASEAAEKGSLSRAYRTGAGGWENATLDRFLEALASYATDAGRVQRFRGGCNGTAASSTALAIHDTGARRTRSMVEVLASRACSLRCVATNERLG